LTFYVDINNNPVVSNLAAEPILPYRTTLHVRDACLCLHAQRAARALARRFDAALRPYGLTNQQFSLLMALNRPEPPPMAPVAALLGMDRTSLTAALKPLERRGLAEIVSAPHDRRSRLVRLTEAGATLLVRAMPTWEREHAAIEATLADPAALREGLRALG